MQSITRASTAPRNPSMSLYHHTAMPRMQSTSAATSSTKFTKRADVGAGACLSVGRMALTPLKNISTPSS